MGIGGVPRHGRPASMTEHIEQFFAHEHLPAHLAEVSKPFADLAKVLVRHPSAQSGADGRAPEASRGEGRGRAGEAGEGSAAGGVISAPQERAPRAKWGEATPARSSAAVRAAPGRPSSLHSRSRSPRSRRQNEKRRPYGPAFTTAAPASEGVLRTPPTFSQPSNLGEKPGPHVTESFVSAELGSFTQEGAQEAVHATRSDAAAAIDARSAELGRHSGLPHDRTSQPPLTARRLVRLRAPQKQNGHNGLTM